MGKFNANSLSYSQNLPPFLAKLQGQYNNDRNGERADPILAAQRRAVKKRSASEEAEDAPLVLDDHGDVVAGVTFGKDGAATLDETGGDSNGGGEEAKEGGKTSVAVDSIAGIGAGKKKKVGRVIGGEGDGEGEEGATTDRQKRKRPTRGDDDNDPTTKDTKDTRGSKDKDTKKKTATAAGGKDKRKKKAKKIQLSFEDDEDEG